MREFLQTQLKRRGVVIGLSGGIDSTVTAALAVRAFGPERVLGLEMPERHSAEETLHFSGLAAAHLGIGAVTGRHLRHTGVGRILQEIRCSRPIGCSRVWRGMEIEDRHLKRNGRSGFYLFFPS